MKVILEYVLRPIGICTAVIAGIAAAVFFSMTKVEFMATLRMRYAIFCVTIGFLFGGIQIRVQMKIEYEPLGGLFISIRRANGEYKIRGKIGESKGKKTEKRVQKLVMRCTTVEKVDIAGEIGFKSDTFYSVMAAGVASVLIENILPVLITAKMNLGKKYMQHVNLFPSFGRNSLSLNLEGIAKINQLKLIYGTVKLVLAKAVGKGSNP